MARTPANKRPPTPINPANQAAAGGKPTTPQPVGLVSPLPQRRDRLTPERERRLLELHLEHCPNCAYELAMVEAVDVMVRMCEDCEGIWLTREHLETLMGYPPEKRKAFIDGLFGGELDTSAETGPGSK